MTPQPSEHPVQEAGHEPSEPEELDTLRARVTACEEAMRDAANILEAGDIHDPVSRAWERLTETLDGGFERLS